MKRDLKFYMSLDYPVEIRRLSEEDGGGYLACIPLSGEMDVHRRRRHH